MTKKTNSTVVYPDGCTQKIDSVVIKENINPNIIGTHFLEVLSNDDKIYEITEIIDSQKVKDVLENYSLEVHTLCISGDDIWEHRDARTKQLKGHTYNIYINIEKDIYKDLFETKMFAIDVDGNANLINKSHGLPKYYEPIPGENLKVAIYSDRLDKQYELDELLSLTGVKGEILKFDRFKGNENKHKVATLKPDLYKYILHMKKAS